MLVYSFIKVNGTSEDKVVLCEEELKGHFILSLTVVPSELQTSEGAFVTISDIIIDGRKVHGFRKQTIELSAYQEGDIKVMYIGEAEARHYRSVSLVLDYESDEDGNHPGCYFLNGQNQKQQFNILSESIRKVHFTKHFEIRPDSTTEIVIKYDNHKITVPTLEKHGSNEFDYSDNGIVNSFNALIKDKCGEVKGEVNQPFYPVGDMYVLAYKRGEFNLTEETRMVGREDNFFPNAAARSLVKPYGCYHLPLLEEGDYEIHIAVVNKDSGKVFMLRGMINHSSNISGFLLNKIRVRAKSRVQLNIDILDVI